MESAARLGADAFYLRGLIETNDKVSSLLHEYAGSLALIVPAQHEKFHSIAAAVHFSERDGWTPIPGISCGRSCHDKKGVERAEQSGFDYVFLSPVFETPTHPEAAALGLEYLEDVCSTVEIPVFALGGINPGNEQACRHVGAYGTAAISMFAE